MTDVTADTSAASNASERSIQGIIEYVQRESGYELGDFPMAQAVFWMPPGHPNVTSPFRDANGFPIALRANQPWPGTADTIIFIFEDSSEFRLYTLPFPPAGAAPDPGNPPMARRFVLSKLSFCYSSQVMSFEAWRDLVVDDIRVAAGEDDEPIEPEPDDDDDDETPAAPGTGAAPAAPRTT
jgi:hypothetical protein